MKIAPLVEALAIATTPRVRLDAAIALWRRTRDPAVAAVIDRVGPELAPPATEWLDDARHPSDAMTGTLAATLMRDAPDSNVFIARVRVLDRRAPDPRIAASLVDVASAWPWRFRTADEVRAIVRPVMLVLAEIADPRCLAPLRAQLGAPVAKRTAVRAAIDDQLRTCIQQIEARGAPYLVPSLQRAAESLTLEPSLLASVYADPSDEAARAVLVDHWFETDHPRGKFDSPATIAKHEPEWLGAVARVTCDRVWERGFLVEATLLGDDVVSNNVWDAAKNEAVLATVRALRPGAASDEMFLRFVRSRVLVSLSEVHVPNRRDGFNVDMRRATDLHFDYPLDPHDAQSLVTAKRMSPELRSVTFSFRQKDGSGTLVEVGAIFRAQYPKIVLVAQARDRAVISALAAPFLALGRAEIRSGPIRIAFDGEQHLALTCTDLRLFAKLIPAFAKRRPFWDVSLQVPAGETPRIDQPEPLVVALSKLNLAPDEPWREVLRNRSARQA